KPQNSKYSRRVSRTSGSSSTTRMLPLSLTMACPDRSCRTIPQSTCFARSGNPSVGTLYRPREQAEHVVGGEGLLQQERVRLVEERLNVRRQRIAGDEDQPIRHIGALPPERSVETKSVEHRHPDVAEDQVVRNRQGSLQAAPTICRNVGFVAI